MSAKNAVAAGGSVPSRWKQYAAGAHDLAADADGSGGAARKIVMLEAGDLTVCEDASGVDRPLTGLPAGFEHIAIVRAVTSTAPFVAYW